MDHFIIRSYDRETNTPNSQFPSDLPLRPGVNTAGKVIKVRVNQYKVAQWPVKDVYQYDVSLHSHPPYNMNIL